MKQVMVIRKDLVMSSGKISAMVAHASTEATLKSEDPKVKAWRKDGMKKVVLKVNSKEELLNVKKEADRNNLVTALIKDAGKTQVEPGSITCLGIGPDSEEKLNSVTGKLKLL